MREAGTNYFLFGTFQVKHLNFNFIREIFQTIYLTCEGFGKQHSQQNAKRSKKFQLLLLEIKCNVLFRPGSCNFRTRK